jgi:hypothetical protein
MTVYHGTDKTSAEKILSEGILCGNASFGAGICLTIERALNYSAVKCLRHGIKARRIGRILVIEDFDESLLKFSTKDAENAFTLDNSNGSPRRTLMVKVKILTISQAQKLITNK